MPQLACERETTLERRRERAAEAELELEALEESAWPKPTLAGNCKALIAPGHAPPSIAVSNTIVSPLAAKTPSTL
jgi:hypothetical protein